MYWIVNPTATLSKLYTKPMLQWVFNHGGGEMLQLLSRVLSTSIHATSDQCQWQLNWVKKMTTVFFYNARFLDTHGQCVLSRNTPSVSCQLQNTSTTTIVTVHPSVIQLVSLLSRIKRFRFKLDQINFTHAFVSLQSHVLIPFNMASIMTRACSKTRWWWHR